MAARCWVAELTSNVPNLFTDQVFGFGEFGKA